MIDLQAKSKPLIIIAGPTACGKTSASVELAKLINGEVVSADSMQVYKYMDIGTAKIMPEEMQGIKHYLVDELEPDEEFSVAVFQEKAKQYISEIHSKGKIPIMVGGTGFYINAVLYDNDFTEDESDGSIRAELREYLNKNGREALYELLKEVDPQACDTIHINNTKRVIRAIEYFRLTGEKMSEHNKAEKQRQPVYDCKFFVLNMDRDRLYERIDKRIDIMLEQGLVKEVEELHKHYDKHLVSMQGLGYKEIIAYLDGECSLDEAVYTLKRDTRHFAKRQLTWFRHQCDGIWVDVDRLDLDGGKETAEYIYNQI
jgi:tRNA dimethylallyltransferase